MSGYNCPRCGTYRTSPCDCFDHHLGALDNGLTRPRNFAAIDAGFRRWVHSKFGESLALKARASTGGES